MFILWMQGPDKKEMRRTKGSSDHASGRGRKKTNKVKQKQKEEEEEEGDGLYYYGDDDEDSSEEIDYRAVSGQSDKVIYDISETT